jgi:hemoglobin
MVARFAIVGGVHDIDTREDCDRLVWAFYERALADPTIGFIFTDVAHLDLESHVPRIASFWETVLLGERTYFGSPFDVHAALNAKVPLRAAHFEQWVRLWCDTVDELFAGERAEGAKIHAARVAQAFYARLQSIPPVPPSGGIAVTLHGPAQD